MEAGHIHRRTGMAGCHGAQDSQSRTDDSKRGQLTSWKRHFVWPGRQNLSGK